MFIDVQSFSIHFHPIHFLSSSSVAIRGPPHRVRDGSGWKRRVRNGWSFWEPCCWVMRQRLRWDKPTTEYHNKRGAKWSQVCSRILRILRRPVVSCRILSYSVLNIVTCCNVLWLCDMFACHSKSLRMAIAGLWVLWVDHSWSGLGFGTRCQRQLEAELQTSDVTLCPCWNADQEASHSPSIDIES